MVGSHKYGSASALQGGTGLVALDTNVTPEFAAEGIARDVMRIVQQARRDADLDVSDRIPLTIGAEGPVGNAVRAHAGFLAAERLAVSLEVYPLNPGRRGGVPARRSRNFQARLHPRHP